MGSCDRPAGRLIMAYQLLDLNIKDQSGNNFRFWANYAFESICFVIIVKGVSAWKPLLHKSSG
jgi:hypothetical protein